MLLYDIFDCIENNEPIIQRALDKVKSELISMNDELYELTKTEMDECKKRYKSQVPIDVTYEQRKQIYKHIDEIISEVDKFVKAQMTIGERKIHREVSMAISKLDNLTEIVSEDINKEILEKLNEVTIITTAKQPPVQFSFRDDEISDLIMLSKKYSNLCIQGIGGVGKTSILRYLYHNMNFENLLPIWINYSGDLESDLLSSVQMSDKLSIQQKREKIKQFVYTNKYKIIMFIDDVDERLMKDSLFDFIDGGVKIIVSSRLEYLTDTFYCYKIEEMEDDESVELFWKYYGTRNEKAEGMVRKMIKKVECHTLMIELLAKAAAFSDSDLETFI